MSKQFAIIELGLVGRSLVRTLRDLGHDVLGIDHDENVIQDLLNELPDVHLVTADGTEPHVCLTGPRA